MSLIQQTQRIQELLGKHSDERGTQTAELILFDQFIQIDAEKFKHEAKMLAMDKRVLQPEEMVVIVLVVFAVQLGKESVECQKFTLDTGTYQIQHGNLHHALVKVCRLVLNHFYRHNLLGLHILAFDHLTKCPLAQDVQDEIAILVARFLTPKNVIDV